MSRNQFQYPQIDMKETGRLLREFSRHKGITVKEIQKALGIASNQAIYDWFNGKNLPTLNNFYALSRLLGISMECMIVVDECGKLPEMYMETVDSNRCIRRLKEYIDFFAHAAYAVAECG